MIHAAEEFHRITAANDSPLGISAGAASIDLAKTVEWKDGIVSRLTGGVAGLMKRAGARYMQGSARFLDGKTVSVKTGDTETEIRAEHIVIASGSAPAELPFLPFGGDILSSTEALALNDVPETLAVVGGGYIGLELGTAYAKLGSKVTVVEAESRILPTYDKALTTPVAKRLEALGVTVMTGTKAQGYEGGQLATDQGLVAAEKVLVTVGRRPRTQGIGVEELALTLDGPFIRIDQTCQTSMRGIYAIGDVTGEPMLAHRAMAQGEMVAEHIAGHSVEWDKRAIPAVCFTDPEIVTCGALPGELDGTKASEFPFMANGRAKANFATEGFVKLLADAETDRILGCHVIGPSAGDLIHEVCVAMEFGASAEDLAMTCHAHPTYSEAMREAALACGMGAIHA